MKLFQGKTYEPEGGKEPEPEVRIEEPKKASHKVIIFGIVGVLVVILIAISVLSLTGKKPAEETKTDDVEVGDSDYWAQYDVSKNYSEADKELLRSWGYTGDEIESNEQKQTPVDQLVEESKKEQEATREKLSNPSSPEYQKLLNDTWLGQSPINLPPYKKDVTESELTYITHTYNADYEKIPPHGHNLFLKVYLPDHSYTFMPCEITRFMQLGDAGNIVVNYTEVSYGKITIIENMKEVQIDADGDDGN